MLVDTNKRDTRTTIFGHKVNGPIGFAPVGINKIYHPAGELPVARAAGGLGLPYALSTAGSQPIEDVGTANDTGAAASKDGSGSAVRFFQLYMPHDDALTRSLLQRAHNSGFTACILTLDTWQLGWRHDDVATSNYAFYHGIGADLGLSDPVFQQRLKEAGIDPQKQPNEAGAMWIDQVWHGRAHTWEKAVWAMEVWKEISGGKPFVLKGIQSVDDAKKSVEMGFDGLVVSNHAGRQVDGACASLDALERIVEGGFSTSLCYYQSRANVHSCWRPNNRHVRLRRPICIRRLQSPRARRTIRLGRTAVDLGPLYHGRDRGGSCDSLAASRPGYPDERRGLHICRADQEGG